MSNRHAQSRRAFEELATKRGYDLERNGHTYVNQLTNDAFAMYEAGCRQQSPVQEAGPWTAVQAKDGSLYIQSDDSAHDAQLRISGDFGDDQTRLAYAEEMARRLNRASAQSIQLDGEVPYERCRAYFLALARVLDALSMDESQNLRHAPERIAASVSAALAARGIASSL